MLSCTVYCAFVLTIFEKILRQKIGTIFRVCCKGNGWASNWGSVVSIEV